MNFLDSRLPERFWSKCTPEPNSGCWLWLAFVHHDGYGRFRFSSRMAVAHRVAYAALVGEVPSGLQLDHLCRERSCCNPAHLEPVTQQVNILRGDAGAHERLKTHCPHGHEYTEENTYMSPGRVHRDCKTCRLGRQKRKRDNKTAALSLADEAVSS